MEVDKVATRGIHKDAYGAAVQCQPRLSLNHAAELCDTTSGCDPSTLNSHGVAPSHVRKISLS